MKGKSILIYAGGVAALLLIGAAGTLLFVGIRRLTETRQGLEQKMEEVNRYYRDNPFPSPENIAIEKKNVEVASDWYTNIVQTLNKGELQCSPKTPAQFMSILAERRNAMLSKSRDAGVPLPDSFTFSFDRYFKERGLPAGPDVARLMQQLSIIENLCSDFFDEKIKIVAIQREEFEGQPASVGAPGGGGPPGDRSRDRSVSAPGSRLNPNAGRKTGEGALYARWHFGVDCRAKEAGLLKLLNRLAKNPMFIAVTTVQLEKDGQDVLAAPLVEKTAVVEGSRISATNAPVIIQEAPNRRKRVVSGPDREPMLRIKLEMDVCTLWGD